MGSEVSSAERKAILRDPSGWLKTAGTAADGEALHALLDEKARLAEQRGELGERSRQLSRAIGEARKSGQAFDAELAEKKRLSATEKELARQISELDDRIVAACLPEPAADEPAVTVAPLQTLARGVAATRIRIEPLARGDEPQWDAYVQAHPGSSVYHLSAWRDIVAGVFGHESCYLAARADGNIVGVLPLIRLRSRLFGDFMVSMPFFNYGGVLSDNADVAAWLVDAATDQARSAGCSHIELRDTGELALPERTDKVAMWLALPDDATALWEQVGAKVRAQVKKAERHRLRTVIGGDELLDAFYRVFAANMRDLGTPVYSRRLFESILHSGPGRSRLVVVYHDSRPVSAAFLLGWRGQLEVPWASTLRSANRFNANMLMYWRMLSFACDHGYTTFDFGRSTRDAPTFRFKKQWGARPVQLHWHYWLADGGEPPKLNPDNPKYRLAIAAWQRLPVWLTRLIGPPIVRNLP